MDASRRRNRPGTKAADLYNWPLLNIKEYKGQFAA